VTDNYNIVLTQDGITKLFAPDLMVTHIRRLARERDEYLQVGFFNQTFILVSFSHSNSDTKYIASLSFHP
jgi:hypothetical protein